MQRRELLARLSKVSLAAATEPLWSNALGRLALGQFASSYKAVVVVTLVGGNDGNNMLIPVDPVEYNSYAKLRGEVALPRGSCIPLLPTAGGKSYGLHPALVNTANLYNARRACIVANVGPLAQPATKDQIVANPALLPAVLQDHPVGINQWESAQTSATPTTGWGGRVADVISSMSGSLPPVLNAGINSLFQVGRSVQGIAVQANGVYPALPADLNAVALQMAANDGSSPNVRVQQIATFRAASMRQQVLLDQAAQYRTLKTVFPGTTFGRAMGRLAQFIAGRSVVGASRQIFYTQQGAYDTHADQFNVQSAQLAELDGGLGAFFQALDEMGVSNQVLVCTHSDFSRTMQSNGNGGSDHGWGNQQLVVGGGISGGRIIGSLPELEFGGSSDLTGLGVWIPTQSVTQMAAGIAKWFGLNSAQLANVFPDLANFQSGAISF